MRWILVFMFWFVPLSAYSDLIDYQIQGHAEWLSHGDSSDITVSFSVDTESWKWESLSVELWGRTWMPTDSANNQISVWSDEPEGGPTHWFNWSPSVESLGEVITFQPFPEWKLHLVNEEIANDPLRFLDQSFFVSEFATLNTGETLGLSGQILKAAQVTEGASILLLITGLILFGFQQFFRQVHGRTCHFR
ncbi:MULTISPECIES: hypothetical protein [Marinobacter]|jgi:hypothetical protein|uniref:hypothetical protein n=1 Tax=Marinobacter TaxID=2742 RepID=UPI000FCB05DB|nr:MULTISPECIES: hypothetical protein [Marinobacter]MCC4282381.1 hypothetical protein [Marinobacter salarius]MDM8180480.1 hypothetical protein [Marinobacter salarius]RUT74895.1 hypothetical protein EHM94_06805 [Marinobacter sp. NP-6]VVT02370.1 conserved hypothetical protein [Marinobacter salarius]VXC27013.1 conserved hypothetical protein [Marinobacter salarius]|tara:strand:- start:4087 stop:4662 length:576 start_codon:yes stop_codon:yes gene_type:complete